MRKLFLGVTIEVKKMKLISVVTPCYNEEGNVREVYRQVKDVFAGLPGYEYEHIFIDNASEDDTVRILKEIASADRNVKIIINTRNFGSIKSPYHALLQTNGDAVTIVVADLQEPPAMIKNFIKKWEEGYKIVIGIKKKSRENPFLFQTKKIYYNLLDRISETEHIRNFNGFGLYDKSFIDILRTINEPYPYLRGLVGEFGLKRAELDYEQQRRQSGRTSNNFYKLYDIAMLGLTNHSKLPLRLAGLIGFVTAFFSLLTAIGYFIYKLFNWENFTVGIAPVVIGLFFFSAVQLFFLGMVGEYIGSIFTKVQNRPLVIEKERINFDVPVQEVRREHVPDATRYK